MMAELKTAKPVKGYEGLYSVDDKLNYPNVCMSADCDDPTLQNEGAMVFTQQKETIDGEN